MLTCARFAAAGLTVAAAIAGFRHTTWVPADDMLVIWVRDRPEQTAIYRESLDDYLAEHPDARWRMEVIPSRAILQKFLTGIDAGHAPRRGQPPLAVDAPGGRHGPAPGPRQPAGPRRHRPRRLLPDRPAGLLLPRRPVRHAPEGLHGDRVLQPGPLRPLRRRVSHPGLDVGGDAGQGQAADRGRGRRRPAGRVRPVAVRHRQLRVERRRPLRALGGRPLGLQPRRPRRRSRRCGSTWSSSAATRSARRAPGSAPRRR